MYVYPMPEGSAAEHLAMEEALFHQVSEDLLILWSHAPAIVCGKYQNIYQEIPVYEAYRRGIPILRRESGGGTVYHDAGNLNYSILTSVRDGVDYDSLLSDLLFALRALGISAERRNSCDIFWRDKKVSGNAQTVRKGRLLHHGTLLIDVDLSTLRTMSARKDRVYTSKAMRSRPAHVANLSDAWRGRKQGESPLLGDKKKRSSKDRAREVAQFQKELLSHWKHPLSFLVPPQSVFSEASKLLSSKYSHREWNLFHSATFRCQAQGLFHGCPVAVDYEAKNGFLTSCVIQSDELPDDVGRRLEGVSLDPRDIESACQNLAGKSASELAAFLL